MKGGRLFAGSGLLPGHRRGWASGTSGEGWEEICCSPDPRGGSGLSAAAPVASSGHLGGGGLGEGKDLHLGLTRARNLTWYLKVSFGIRLEAQVMVSCVTTPLQWSLGGLLFLLSVSETFLIHVDPRTLCPLLRLSFLPCLVAMVSHRPCDGCCEQNAGTEAGSWGSLASSILDGTPQKA